jgi:hypothetical protein
MTRSLRRSSRGLTSRTSGEASRAEIEALRKAQAEEGSDGPLDFMVPLEILVPSDLENDAVVDDFNGSLLDICAARNNNVELTLETKANKKGFFEYLRKSLPRKIADRVEWKTNDGGEVEVRDIIALSWIPLAVIQLPSGISLPPATIYHKKGDCAKKFDELMSNEDVSKVTGDDYTHELHNTGVHSALVMVGQLPELYDKIYRDFPEAYNDSGGKFGKISIVKMAKDMRTKPTTPFTDEPVDYSYPDGLIMPLVYGLKALMEIDEKGPVRWKENRIKFLGDCLPTIVKKYRVVLDAFNFNPQKIAKHDGSYELVLDAFETELIKRKAAAA